MGRASQGFQEWRDMSMLLAAREYSTLVETSVEGLDL